MKKFNNIWHVIIPLPYIIE